MTISIKYLFIYFKISIVLSLIYIAAFGILLYSNIDVQLFITLFLLSIIPCVSSSIILLIGKYTSIKHPKLTKITANIINLAVFLIHGFLIFSIFIIGWAFSSDFYDPKYTEIKDYQKALNTYYPDAVEHFPKQIPENAKNISMLRSSDSFTGDSTFYLKFYTDSNYIQHEIEKYKNKSEIILFNKDDYFINRVYNHETQAAIILNNIIDEDIKNWTMFLLERNQCFRGFATKDNTIVYILSCD